MGNGGAGLNEYVQPADYGLIPRISEALFSSIAAAPLHDADAPGVSFSYSVEVGKLVKCSTSSHECFMYTCFLLRNIAKIVVVEVHTAK